MYKTSSKSGAVQNRIFLREVESQRSVLTHFTSQKNKHVFTLLDSSNKLVPRLREHPEQPNLCVIFKSKKQ